MSKKKYIVVAEERPVFAEIYRQHIEQQGYLVLTCTTHEELWLCFRASASNIGCLILGRMYVRMLHEFLRDMRSEQLLSLIPMALVNTPWSTDQNTVVEELQTTNADLYAQGVDWIGSNMNWDELLQMVKILTNYNKNGKQI